MTFHRVIEGDCLKVLPTITEKIDAVVCDPPYGLGIGYTTYDDNRENLQRLIDGFMPEARRLASRVFVTPGQSQVGMYPAPDWVLAVTWDTTGTFGAFGYSQWMPVLCYGDDIKGFGRVNGVLKSDTIRLTGGGGVGFMREDGVNAHPCPKPANVMKLLIQRLTEPDSTILDPFGGSGTTAVAAKMTGRNSITIEIDPGYCEIARRRIADAASLFHQGAAP